MGERKVNRGVWNALTWGFVLFLCFPGLAQTESADPAGSESVEEHSDTSDGQTDGAEEGQGSEGEEAAETEPADADQDSAAWEDEVARARQEAATAEKGDGVRTTRAIVYKESRPKVSPLVEAARKAQEKNSDGTGKTFTNADVLRAKGSIIVIESSNPRPPAPDIVIEPKDETPEERKERIRKQQQEAAEKVRIGKLRAELIKVRKELAEIEEAYYLEEDDDIRQRVIEPKYRELRERLREIETELGETGDDQ